MEFKDGDKVELKSGGPTMTVSSLQKDGTYWCIWFNGNGNTWEVKGMSFKPAVLKKA